ncbi:hypothetical protein SCHIN_v1c11700 [Spiroplasma chinense]|uniref:Uncharacterized protein n=1 Tax=Spiroplasma chinense TaxID=216932 RepID=A0A5B9Y6B6_9MOLU|nr:hypothetical protein [Spiroplasma chinense]QEH62363.1 hypothetical protein SCHIN_v1c11700 [Spiroplasma chinense]
MKQIKPIEYERIVVSMINEVYENFAKNHKIDFKAPENIEEFFKNNKSLDVRKDIENFGIELDKTFGDWKPLDENMDRMIVINHLLAILQNSIIVLMSIDKNLESEKLENEKIVEMGGVDILIATGVQALGVKANELTELFDELKLKNDPLIVFEQLNKHFIAIKNLEAEQAFSLFMQNVLEFITSYRNTYEKLSQVKEDEFSQNRIQMFMEYMNAYYLLVILLKLTLVYPYQEGLIEQQAYENIVPNIKLYK